jgi:hypothetical protein
MYSGETEYEACDVTLGVNPHRASLKNMPGHGGNKVIITKCMILKLYYNVHDYNVHDLKSM